MAKIKLLDSLTIQKIAAGEVIENPSSIVKELVENSLDADSQNIIIEIKNGGKSYIRITDDGEGISREDLMVAFERHSTSKLNSVDDIYSIFSLGFRGEALASVSSVAKMEVLTKTMDSQGGVHAIVEEGEITSIDSAGCPKGTTMIVRDLFYNLPVRKKFLKSDLAESNQINDIINKLALGNSNVSFKFIRDHKTILQTTRTNNPLDTIYSILGKDFAKNLISIDYEDSYIKIKGFISNNNLYRGNRSHQYLYINGRNIINYGISKVIENRYKSLIPINRFPAFVLNIELDPGEVDINIHPTKQEIKFVDTDRVFGTISNIVNNQILNSLNVPKMSFKKEEEKAPNKELPELFNLNTQNKNITEDIIIRDFTQKDIGKDTEPSMVREMEVNLDDLSYDISLANNRKFPHESQESYIEKNMEEEPVEEQKLQDYLLDIKPIGRVFDTYIIAESKEENKIFFIDQHAAHERIMYEKYKKEYENEEINTQQLIFPEIIELTNNEMNRFIENIEIFKNLGFDLEEFGPNSVALRGVPFIFGSPRTKDLFFDILDNIDSNIKSNYHTKMDKIMKIACTNAIKSGDQISNMEIMALFKDLQKCENPFTCPHGRPTVVEMTKKDIEKEFLRIV